MNTYEEPDNIPPFRSWFIANGGYIHEDLYFSIDSSGLGLGVRTRNKLPPGTMAISCPFALAITLESVDEALEKICRLEEEERRELTPRQRVCAYIGLYFILQEKEDMEDENYRYIHILRHRPYIAILPKAENMLTPLYFTEEELELFRGSNMYGAAVDQIKTCMEEHRQLCTMIGRRSRSIADKFSFELYKLGWTYLSSRAFPSTVLSSRPSLTVTPDSYPVLIPGIDILNHKRAQPVSWTVSRIACDETYQEQDQSNLNANANLSLSLVMETPTEEGEELFNNYGPKPNSSLILGYGFTIPDNPDDTILLKIGIGIGDGLGDGDDGIVDQSEDRDRDGDRHVHEVGRQASGAQALWDDVRRIITIDRERGKKEDDDGDGGDDAEYAEIEIDMQTSEILSHMVSSLISRLPILQDSNSPQPTQPTQIRKEVDTMRNNYVQGQKDILHSLLTWLEGKDREAVRRAEELGISVVEEEEVE